MKFMHRLGILPVQTLPMQTTFKLQTFLHVRAAKRLTALGGTMPETNTAPVYEQDISHRPAWNGPLPNLPEVPK